MRTAQALESEFWRGWEAKLAATEAMWSLAFEGFFGGESSVEGVGREGLISEAMEFSFGGTGSEFPSSTAAIEVKKFLEIGGDFENPNYRFSYFCDLGR